MLWDITIEITIGILEENNVLGTIDRTTNLGED